MILEITGSLPRPIAKKLSWKDELKRSLYRKNRAVLERGEKERRAGRKELQEAQGCLMRLMQCEGLRVKDEMQADTCYSYYSSYVPLHIQTRFHDELAVTFPFIKHKADCGRLNDRTLLLMEISEFMSKSSRRGEVDADWQKTLRKYICDIDSIRAAELYLEFKKFGTGRLEELHRMYGGGCEKRVFFQRVCGAASSFRMATPAVRAPFSVEAHEQINEVTMPKTMKQLFCCICFSYDCNQHSLEDITKEKDYQYVSPRNVLSEQENVRRAVGICAGYAQLLERGAITGEPCSEGCFRRLGRREWEALQLNRVRLLSPMVKGVIKLGIEMYSYNPCAICVLLADLRLSCAHVFLFLVEEHGLMGCLQRKLLGSEALAHSTCAHHFRGEPPSDAQCESCACRERGYCLPQCLCGEGCPIRRRGCGCRKLECRSEKCACFRDNAECDPLVCGSCFGEEIKKSCRNHAILSREFKRVRVGRSAISEAGLGLFAGEAVRRDELLMIYTGELIDNSIDVLRESLSVDSTFYNFGSPEGTIDARFLGNPSRYINHADGGGENLFSKNVLTEGRMKVAFYATRDIEEGEELFFDYDGQGILYKNYKEKYPFIKKNK